MAQVNLRKKKISGNRYSFYLDFYPAIINPESGKLTRRDFLSLYTYQKSKTEFEKRHNKETTELAENIKAKRQLDIQAERYDFFKKKHQKVDFLNYFKDFSNKQSEAQKEIFLCSWIYLDRFTKGKLISSQLNEKFCTDYKEFLHTTSSNRTRNSVLKSKLAENTKHTYFNKFRASLREAFKDGVIKENLFSKTKPIPQNTETLRGFLNQEELQALANTPCTVPILKQVALVSALTGLRWSDIQKLTWNKIMYSQKEGCYIQFIQQKTKGAEVHYISRQAYDLLGERKGEEENVFKDLKYSAQTSTIIQNWVKAAGVKKKITFHSFRHTYATLLISNKVDLYTVSKMLGHRQISTTQIYAKIIDATKREAANAFKLDL